MTFIDGGVGQGTLMLAGEKRNNCPIFFDANLWISPNASNSSAQ
jgi:hypothetical protein